MPTRVAINGFGRIGRNLLRAALAQPAGEGLEWVALNDIAPPETLAHLFRYDSLLGSYDGPIELRGQDLRIAGHEIKVFAQSDPAALPWGELGVDVVVESTGRFTDRSGAEKHLVAGAKKVVVSAPAKDPDVTVVLGVNFDEAYDKERHRIVSNASCTTNCLAPVAKVVAQNVGIRHGLMTTVHAYTADQRLQDMPHKDLRRARAAAVNLVPTSTGAAKAIGLVIPELDGKLHGFAIRAPVPTGSVVDLTVECERSTSAQELNEAFARAAAEGPLRGVLRYSEEELVSTDIVGSPYSAILDGKLTTVIDGTMAKLIAWYDNEWGYSNRLLELVGRLL